MYLDQLPLFEIEGNTFVVTKRTSTGKYATTIQE